MKVKDFLKYHETSSKLSKALNTWFDDNDDVRRIKPIHLSRLRHVGKKTVEEFVKLVGNIDSKIEIVTQISNYEVKDSIVESVINQFKERSEVGIKKYGTTLDRNDLTTLEWINHAQQEAMDFCLYLEKLKQLHNEK